MMARTFFVNAALAVALVAVTSAQGPAPAASDEPGPRRADGKPDFGGVWMPPYVPDMTLNRRDQKGAGELPYTSWGQKDWSSYDAATGDYTGSCFPFGLTRSFNAPYPFQIVQDERVVAFLFEVNNWHHVVRFNANLPAQLEPTWYGHSSARWDGDTLVTETRGFNGYTRLDTVGHPHTDALRVTQTFTRTDARHIAYTVTIDDPKAYTKPWSNERVFTRLDTPLLEYSCEENNKSLWEGRIKTWMPPWANPSK